MRLEDKFPRSFNVQQIAIARACVIEMTLYKVGERMSWEGYYREQRISLFWNGWFWIVAVYKRGTMTGYFRHDKENPDIEDIGQLVSGACGLIDIMLNER